MHRYFFTLETHFMLEVTKFIKGINLLLKLFLTECINIRC